MRFFTRRAVAHTRLDRVDALDRNEVRQVPAVAAPSHDDAAGHWFGGGV